MAVNHPPGPEGPAPALDDRGLSRLAEETGEPLTLLRHLRDLHERPMRTMDPWRGHPAPQLRRLLTEAARRPVKLAQIDRYLRVTDRWTPYLETTPRGLRTTACRRCHSRHRVRPLIAEISGLLCLRCRRDDLDHRWAKGYDAYLDLEPS
jgi:hypothetical protein